MKRIILCLAVAAIFGSCEKTKTDYIQIENTDTVKITDTGILGQWASVDKTYSNVNPYFTKDSMYISGFGSLYFCNSDSIYQYVAPSFIGSVYGYCIKTDTFTLSNKFMGSVKFIRSWF